MEIVSYEKAADQNQYMYIMHWDSMHSVNYRFHNNHIHKAVELVVCEDGNMRFKSENGIGTIGPKQILIFNSFDKHFYEYINEFKGYIVVLSMDFLNDILTSSVFEFKNVISIDNDDWEEISKLFAKLFSKNNEMSFLEKKAFVLLIFNILNKYDILLNKSDLTIKDISSQILEYIDVNYASDISLQSISKAFGYSPNYFSSLFSKILGSKLTFKKYLNEYRYNKVQEFKTNPQYKNNSLKQIIKMCGFSSFETYYRVAKKHNHYEENMSQ